MLNIPLADMLAKLPVTELEQTLQEFLSPLTNLLPDKRLREVVVLVTKCMLATETPVVATMMRSVSRQEAACWAASQRVYRFLSNQRFNHHQLYKGLYRIAQQTVRQEHPAYLVVA